MGAGLHQKSLPETSYSFLPAALLAYRDQLDGADFLSKIHAAFVHIEKYSRGFLFHVLTLAQFALTVCL